MIVIADTSPVNYLILLDSISVLPRLYHRIVIPQGVIDELRDAQSPPLVRAWCAELPGWVVVHSPQSIATEAEGLGKGEAEAITLAMQAGSSLILMDERQGTERARLLGLETIGLLGILIELSEQGIGNGRDLFLKLQKTSFLISPGIRQQVEDRFARLEEKQ